MSTKKTSKRKKTRKTITLEELVGEFDSVPPPAPVSDDMPIRRTLAYDLAAQKFRADQLAELRKYDNRGRLIR